MEKIHLYDKILSPVVTEKSTNLSELNKIVFKVPNGDFLSATQHNTMIVIIMRGLPFIFSFFALCVSANQVGSPPIWT